MKLTPASLCSVDGLPTVLADIGYKAVNLGPNTPLEVISQSAQHRHTRIAWVSFTSQLANPKVQAMLEKVAKQLGRKKVHLVIGGQESSKYKAPASRHVHAFHSLSEMAGFAQSLLVD